MLINQTYSVLIILVQIDTTLLGFPPSLWNRIVHVCLVYYFRYQVRTIIDEGGIGRGDFGGMNCVGGAIFDQEGEEGEDGADEEEDDDNIDDEEDGEAASHGRWWGKAPPLDGEAELRSQNWRRGEKSM